MTMMKRVHLNKGGFLLMKKMIGFLTVLMVLSFISIFVGVRDLSLLKMTSFDQTDWHIITEVRLPRTISLIIVGAIMSVSGLLMQKLTQNRFVSPTNAGTSESAQLGILLSILFFSYGSPLLRTFVAFLCAFLGTILFLWLIKYLKGPGHLLIPLVGLMFGAVIRSVVTFIAYQYGVTQNITAWMQGNFSLVNQYDMWLLMVGLILLVGVFLFSNHFTLVGMGEEMTAALGAQYERLLYFGILLVALATSVSIAVVGYLPFIGLVIPNIVTYIWGDHLKTAQYYTAALGSIFLVACDLMARLVIRPYEVPVNLIVGILGGILFVGMLLKEGRQSYV